MGLNLQAMPRLVPLHEFIVSPGFAGTAAVIAAVIVLCAALYASRRASRQRERHHQHAREDQQRAVAIERCWGRLKWVVETAGIEPAASEGATLGLGPELALELLRGLRHDAERLDDDALAKAVTVYQEQFVLVLAQQGGPLSELSAAESGSGDGASASQPTSQPAVKPDGQPLAATGETPSATAEVAGSGRRRRQ